MRNTRLFFIVVFIVVLVLLVLLIVVKTNKKPALPEGMRYLVHEGKVIDQKKTKDLFIAYQTYKNVIIDKMDKKGETLIYERYDNNWFSGLGVKQLGKTTLRIIIGRIVEIKPVEKSKDIYVTLEDPIKKEILLTGRIVTTNSLGTDIRVEDVSILRNEEPYIQIIRDPEGKEVSIGDVIKKGDIIILQLTPSNSKDFSILKRDKDGYPYVTRVIIRRFKGDSNL